MIRIEIDKSRVKAKGKSLFLFLDKEEIDDQLAKLDTLPEVYEYKNYKFEIPIRFLESVLTVLEEYELHIYGDIPEKEKKIIDMRNSINEDHIQGDYTFKTKPYDHQVEALDYSREHDNFLLADEQGLGKTKQAIDIAIDRKGRFKHCLIVACVGGLKWNWKKEVVTHSHEGSHIIGHRINRNGAEVIDGLKKRYEDLMRNHEEYFLITDIRTLADKNIRSAIREMCISGEIGMVVVDEIHKCKNPTSMFGEVLNGPKSSGTFLNSYYRLAMTGTPLLNNPVDMYSTLKWLGEEQHTFSDFKSYYCEMEGTDGFRITGYKHMDELQGLIDSVTLRRLKKDVLDLPEKVFINEYVDMSAKQTTIYNEIKTGLIEDIDKIVLSNHPLADIIRLRQATSYPPILSTSGDIGAKFERALELIEEAVENGDKVIVYSNWTDVTTPFYANCKKYKPALVTGKIKNKQDHIESFLNDPDCHVIIGTIASLGTGYTLTAATTIIFLEDPWTQGDKDQAVDRAHRIGAKGTITVYTLICKNTVDERVEQIVAKKGIMSNVLIDRDSIVAGDLSTTELLNYLIF